MRSDRLMSSPMISLSIDDILSRRRWARCSAAASPLTLDNDPAFAMMISGSGNLRPYLSPSDAIRECTASRGGRG